ncbi:MAG: hypothetical protein H0S78_09720 [Tissierellales bacterium]|nr:hypothetical protein [Tissierellales bacterium]
MIKYMDIKNKTINELENKYPFVISFFENNQLEVENKKNKTIEEILDNFTEEEIEEWAIDSEKIKSGLSHIDENQLKDELKLNPKKGQEIIAKYMDYTLKKVEGDEVPKDAIRIAQLMGLQESIINKAKEIIDESN